MTVTRTAIDTWIQHLPFATRRDSIYGGVDGIFYGHVAVLGDASAGAVHLHGLLSAARKTDWVYILGGTGGAINSGTDVMDALINISSGPAIPSVAGNQFFSPTVAQAPLIAATGLGLSTLLSPSGGPPFAGTPVFGDPHIAGDFNIFSVDFQTNVNGATYRSDIWGFLVTYQSFFRELVPPGARIPLIDPRFRL